MIRQSSNGTSARGTLVGLALLGTVLAGSARAQPPQDVNVVNTPSVQIANPPAVERFQKEFTLHFDANDSYDSTTYVVPAGKALVIEFLSVGTTLKNGEVLHAGVATHAGGQFARYNFPSVRWPGVGGLSQVNVANSSVRIYADPGSTVTVSAGRNTFSGPAVSAVLFSLSGHFETVP